MYGTLSTKRRDDCCRHTTTSREDEVMSLAPPEPVMYVTPGMMVELMLPCLSICPAASEPMHWLWRPPMKMPITCRMSVSILDDGKLRNENTKGSAGRGR